MCFGGRGAHRMIEWTYCLSWIKLIVFDCIFLPRSWAGGCLVRVIEKGMVGGCELTVFSVEVEKQVTWMIIEVFLNIFTCSAWKKPYRCFFERDSLTRTTWSKPFVFHTPIRVGFLSMPLCSLCKAAWRLHFIFHYFYFCSCFFNPFVMNPFTWSSSLKQSSEAQW